VVVVVVVVVVVALMATTAVVVRVVVSSVCFETYDEDVRIPLLLSLLYSFFISLINEFILPPLSHYDQVHWDFMSPRLQYYWACPKA